MFKFFVSTVLVAILAISISRRIRLSSRYERAPKKLSPWSSLDKGIDPTVQRTGSHADKEIENPE
jgi:hypothetical protein